MNAEERMSFREWTEHYEKEQEVQRQQIGDLTKIVHSLSADVRTLVENQRGMFSRLNKSQGPIIVAATAIVISAIGVLATFISLTVSPIKEELVRMNQTDLRYRESTDEVLTMLADNVTEARVDVQVLREAQRWQEKMTDMTRDDMDWMHERLRMIRIEE